MRLELASTGVFGDVRFCRTREGTVMQEFRVHEPSLQGEMDVQQIRGWRAKPPRHSARLPAVRDRNSTGGSRGLSLVDVKVDFTF